MTGSRQRCAPSTPGACAASAGATPSPRPTPGSGPPATRRPATGCSLEVLVDGADRLSRDRRGHRQRPRPRPRVRLARRAVLRADPRRARPPASASCSPRRPSGSTCGCWCGRARRCRPSTPPARRSATAVEELTRRHSDPLRGRPARASVPLPPREDDRGGRRGRVRGRDRHDRLRRRSLRLLRPSGSSAAGLARRRHPPARPGRQRRPRSLRAALARADRRATGTPGGPAAGRRSHRPGRPHRRREHVRGRAPTATSGCSRATCARSAAPSGSSTSRTSSCGRPRSSDLLADKLRRPPHPDFRLVLLLPARANNGQDDTMGQLGRSSAPTTVPADCWPRRFARCPATATTGCTCTPRWGSSTTAG